tara:strand:+ start:105 stop:458 length:354 start_codon:yes stop_codon:yes gene_type:complete
MGLFSRRNRTRKDASRAIRSITGGLMGGNSQQNYQDDVMSSLENISEQLGSIGATSAASSSVQTPNAPNDVNDTASATIIDPTEVQESMMGDNNPASVSSALLKRYKGSCKMKLKNK